MKFVAFLLLILCAVPTPARAETPSEATASLAQMPVKEVTIFKDGHAFVVHEGRVPTDDEGHVILDRLPTPVLGTFWPYSVERDVKLSAVTAGRRRVRREQTALDVRSFLEANPGAAVDLVDLDGKTLSGRIQGVPTRTVDELEATGEAPTRDLLPVKGSVVLLETGQGILALPLDRVRSASFKDAPATKLAGESFRNLLTLAFAWPEARPRREIEVGMAYVQKGLRWIPSYKVTIDGAGTARVQLQATLVNELVDLEDVTANLVVGVPTFAFKDMVDPMALQETVAQLGGYFDAKSPSGWALSNSIMTQGAISDESRFREGDRPRSDVAPDLGPELAGSEKDEDLFVFTIKRVTLKKGERMVLPVAEYELAYRDVYILDLPFAPPPEVRASVNDAQQREMARLLGAPHFTHVLRIANSGREPLTTAPALITSGDRVLGQGRMSYAAPGGECDLSLTTAMDIAVTKGDKEVGRVPNALSVNGSDYLRVDLRGEIGMVNRREAPVDVEVTRSVLGHVDAAGQMGKADMINAYEDASAVTQPPWWGWYGWPGWWGAVNGVGRFTWKARIEAGQKLAFTYTWHYFWI